MTDKEYSSIVSGLFDRLATSYDRGNMLISLGLMPFWRNAAIAQLRKIRPKYVLDLATGTADFAEAIAKEIPSIKHIIGADISSEMLKVGRKKIYKKGLSEVITLVEANALDLPFADESFDTVTCAFGFRNFPSISRSLVEACRVLEPGGHLIILELSEPRNKILRSGHHIYTRTLLKILGKYANFDGNACNYLHNTIENTPQYEELAELIRAAGFENISFQPLSTGIATLFVAKKKSISA